LITLLLALSTFVAAQPKPKNFKLFVFREDCFDLFFNQFDFFSNKECIAVTVSKGIGIAIIAGSAVLKLP
jgi:hypothetical protein